MEVGQEGIWVTREQGRAGWASAGRWLIERDAGLRWVFFLLWPLLPITWERREAKPKRQQKGRLLKAQGKQAEEGALLLGERVQASPGKGSWGHLLGGEEGSGLTEAGREHGEPWQDGCGQAGG